MLSIAPARSLRQTSQPQRRDEPKMRRLYTTRALRAMPPRTTQLGRKAGSERARGRGRRGVSQQRAAATHKYGRPGQSEDPVRATAALSGSVGLRSVLRCALCSGQFQRLSSFSSALLRPGPSFSFLSSPQPRPLRPRPHPARRFFLLSFSCDPRPAHGFIVTFALFLMHPPFVAFRLR
jgi:hypothetical protein